MRTDGVSILIPNWNHELVLPRALRSALAAADELARHGLGCETVVVDDGSRDGSLVLLRQAEALYADRGLRVVAHGRNRGLAQARATGMAAAGYRYAVWLDADNEVEPANVPLFYRAIRDTRAAVVFGNLVIHEPDRIDMVSHESFGVRMFETNHIDTFSLCDLQQWFDAQAVYLGDHSPQEDWERWLHLATGGRTLVHVPVVIGYYYRNPGSYVADHTAGLATIKKLGRVYRQFPAVRDRFPLATKHLRYHPDVGWLN